MDWIFIQQEVFMSSGLDRETLTAIAAGVVGVILVVRYIWIRTREEAHEKEARAAEGRAFKAH